MVSDAKIVEQEGREPVEQQNEPDEPDEPDEYELIVSWTDQLFEQWFNQLVVEWDDLHAAEIQAALDDAQLELRLTEQHAQWFDQRLAELIQNDLPRRFNMQNGWHAGLHVTKRDIRRALVRYSLRKLYSKIHDAIEDAVYLEQTIPLLFAFSPNEPLQNALEMVVQSLRLLRIDATTYESLAQQEKQLVRDGDHIDDVNRIEVIVNQMINSVYFQAGEIRKTQDELLAMMQPK